MIRYPNIPQDQLVNSSNTKHKLDVLDFEALDAHPGPYALDYRVDWDPRPEPWRFLRYAAGVLCLGFMLCLLPLPVLTFLAAPEFAGGALLIGLILVVVEYVRADEQADKFVVVRAALLKILVPFGVWLFLASIAYFTHPAYSGLGILLGGAALVALADRIATHQLWFYTANPFLSEETSRKWRSAWRRRFFLPKWVSTAHTGLPEETRLRHWYGVKAFHRFTGRFMWLFMLWCLLLFFPIVTRDLLGLTLSRFLSVMLVLICLAIWAIAVNDGHWKKSVSLVSQAIMSYFGYLRDLRVPGWCLTSPAGSQYCRQVQLLLLLGYLGVVSSLFADFYPVTALIPGPWHGVVERVAPGASAMFPQPYVDLVDHRPGWKTLLWLGVLNGDSFFIFQLVASFLLFLIVPLVAFFLVMLIFLGPLLPHLDEALEDPALAYEHEKGFLSAWDAYASRLRKSANPRERGSLLLSVNVPYGYPLLIDWKLVFEHFYILGGTGQGKTHLGLAHLLIQVMRLSEEVDIEEDAIGNAAVGTDVAPAGPNEDPPSSGAPPAHESGEAVLISSDGSSETNRRTP